MWENSDIMLGLRLTSLLAGLLPGDIFEKHVKYKSQHSPKYMYTTRLVLLYRVIKCVVVVMRLVSVAAETE